MHAVRSTRLREQRGGRSAGEKHPLASSASPATEALFSEPTRALLESQSARDRCCSTDFSLRSFSSFLRIRVRFKSER